MNWSGKTGFGFLRGQKGFSLLENVVAVSILATIGVVFLGALFSGYRNIGILDEQQQAEALIRTQLEDIKSLPYDESGAYSVTVTPPPQYSINITTTAPTCIGTADSCVPLEDLVGAPVTTIQEITVSIFHNNKPVLAIACYKAIQ